MKKGLALSIKMYDFNCFEIILPNNNIRKIKKIDNNLNIAAFEYLI